MARKHARTRLIAGALLSLTMAVSVTSVTATPASAIALAKPTGLTPSSGATNVTPVLSWGTVKNATQYDVEVSVNASYDDPIYEVTTANRQATPTKQLPMVKLYWRVRARSGSDNGPWATASFSRTRLNGPTLVSPANAASLPQPTQPPLLKWSVVAGATSYNVEVDSGDTPDWVDTDSYQTTTSSLVVPGALEAGTYWWRVTAALGAGQLTFPSEERSYVVGDLGDITGASPVMDAEVEEVVLDWDSLPGAASYDIRISTDDSFGSIVDSKNVKGTRYSPAKTYDVDDYWWQVRPRNVFNVAPDWSGLPKRHFKRTYDPVPTLQYPPNTLAPSVGDDFYYQWTPVRLASRYRLDVGDDMNFSPNTFTSCFTTQTTYTPYFRNSPSSDDCSPDIGSANYWRVKALDGSGAEIQGIYSAISKFVYNPGLVDVLTPANGASVDVPTLTWNPYIDAVKYEVEIVWNGGQIVDTTYSTSYTPDFLNPADGTFTWRVTAIDAYGGKSSYPIFGRTFTLTGNPPPDSGEDDLTPLTPTSGDSPTLRFPSLTWEPLDGAYRYKVYIGDHGTGFFEASLDAPRFPALTDSSDDWIRPGEYDWFVVALTNTNQILGTGATGTFTIADLDTVTGHEVALRGSTLNLPHTADPTTDIEPCTKSLLVGDQRCGEMRETPVLEWDPVPGVGYYLIYVSRSRNFQNMVYGTYSNPNSLPKTANTRWTPTNQLQEDQAGASAYYWFIRPCKADGICAPDPTLANHAFEKRSQPIRGMTILTEGDEVEAGKPSNDVVFDWEDYLTTNQDSDFPNIETNEQAGQSAMSYRIQVDDSASFTSPLDEAIVDQSTYTAHTKLYPEGDLWWRVQAIDGSNNSLNLVDGVKFTKKSAAPDPMGPSGDSFETQPFRWSATAFANSYDLEVYKNGDTAASSANRVLSRQGITSTAFANNTPFPAGTTYVWRVRRADASGNKGAWSTWSSFKVIGSPPIPGVPADKAKVSSKNALFTWGAANGAVHYKWERRKLGTSSVVDSMITDSTAWAPINGIETGIWQWRVASLDVNNQVISVSAWRTFTVDATAPQVKKKKPEGTATRSSNFVVKFTEPVKGVTKKTFAIYVTGKKEALKAKVTLSGNGKKATLNPASPLVKGKTYTLKLGKGITDLAGIPLAPLEWTVSTS